MSPDRVDQMLHNYREYLGRVSHLEQKIAELEREIQALKATALTEAAVPAGPNMDGMPHGSIVGQPTERIATMFADGWWPEHITEKEKELKALEAEYQDKAPTVIFVGAWLEGLTVKERWIVEHRMIDEMPWRELTALYIHDFNDTRTKDGLRRMKIRAMEKVYRIAE